MQMRRVFDFYKQIVQSRIQSSSQGITEEQIDMDRDPLENIPYENEDEEGDIEDVPHINLEKASKSTKIIQSFLRGKLSQNKAVAKTTIQRPPHRTHKPIPYSRFSLSLN